ncbi:MAG: Rossman fold protein, TIGR00730 family [Elusimicrobia bacterium RBG_16_66_12]|nr:MAG: Rossman fold protein, TIGR00730 family [Elusimicrobia bacterium RBG_16_66_12]
MNPRTTKELLPEEKLALLVKIRESKAYLKAYHDTDFMGRKDLRAVRLQLELLKPELILREHKIRSTIVVFGSARILSPEEAQRRLKSAQEDLSGHPRDVELKRLVVDAEKKLEYSRWYTQARRFASVLSKAQQQGQDLEYVIVTGGGPGVMEAANRGAWECGAKSIGLNITLPHEQDPNPYITPELCMQFHYFSLRKMHFLMRARALVAFPGGYGTLDELFETLTLVQTGKKRPLPIVLFGRQFWKRLVDFDYLAEQGLIGRDDTRLFKVVETAEEGWDHIRRFWKTHRGGVPTE